MCEIVILSICNLTQTMRGCLYDHPESPPSIISVYIFFEIYFIITVTVGGVTQSHSSHSKSLLKLRQLTLGDFIRSARVTFTSHSLEILEVSHCHSSHSSTVNRTHSRMTEVRVRLRVRLDSTDLYIASCVEMERAAPYKCVMRE